MACAFAGDCEAKYTKPAGYACDTCAYLHSWVLEEKKLAPFLSEDARARIVQLARDKKNRNMNWCATEDDEYQGAAWQKPFRARLKERKNKKCDPTSVDKGELCASCKIVAGGWYQGRFHEGRVRHYCVLKHQEAPEVFKTKQMPPVGAPCAPVREQSEICEICQKHYRNHDAALLATWFEDSNGRMRLNGPARHGFGFLF
ncbi:hypothetical protein BDV95DRAFT_214452 [Massariosphaeria phaeospora]|uniref:Uncharacterized protein n=1 Tax=Massariosphaeria phaeospora TaxID=100035 RepID=A0A7C8HZF2_9PLEO|nr:hypothetical protein BDV95DRAFT_214452 [Massariosphaeria phaeospora]